MISSDVTTLGWAGSSGPSSANALTEERPKQATAITMTNASRRDFIKDSVAKPRRKVLGRYSEIRSSLRRPAPFTRRADESRVNHGEAVTGSAASEILTSSEILYHAALRLYVVRCPTRHATHSPRRGSASLLHGPARDREPGCASRSPRRIRLGSRRGTSVCGLATRNGAHPGSSIRRRSPRRMASGTFPRTRTQRGPYRRGGECVRRPSWQAAIQIVGQAIYRAERTYRYGFSRWNSAQLAPAGEPSVWSRGLRQRRWGCRVTGSRRRSSRRENYACYSARFHR